MDKLLDKISKYHLINYIIPGVFAVYLSRSLNEVDLLTKDLFLDVVFVYIMGLICSRIGSLVVEPILKWIGFVKFSDYKDYLSAEKKDPKLSDLVIDDNLYRTVVGSILFILLQFIFLWLCEKCTLIKDLSSIIVLTVLLLLFVFSYKKQSSYIKQRVEKYKE